MNKSCAACRKKHIKCNTKQPCKACEKSRSNCSYEPPKPKGRTKGSTQQKLKDKVIELERAIALEKREQSRLKDLLMDFKHASIHSPSHSKRKRFPPLVVNSTSFRLMRATEVQTSVSQFKAFTGSKIPPFCMKPIDFEQFFSGEVTDSNYQLYCILAMHQLYNKNEEYAREFERRAVNLLNRLEHRPTATTAIGTLVLSAYFIGSERPYKSLCYVELADDMMQYLAMKRRFMTDSQRKNDLITKIRIIRLSFLQYKYISMTSGYQTERNWAKQALKRVYNDLKNDDIYNYDPVSLMNVTISLADIEVNHWIQTKNKAYKKSGREYLSASLQLAESIPGQAVHQFFCYCIATRLYSMMGLKDDAISTAFKSKDKLEYIVKAPGMYPFIGFYAIDAWYTFNTYGYKRETEALWHTIQALSVIYPAIQGKVENVQQSGVAVPPFVESKGSLLYKYYNDFKAAEE